MSQLRASQKHVWNLNDVLGQGATGAVYICRHKKTGEKFAVKTFNMLSRHQRPLEIQMREFDVLERLNHPNIVKLLGVEEENSDHSKVIIMELCTGGSLFTLLDDPDNGYGMDEDEFLLVLDHVTCGLKHLRDQNVVHRDIKPGNILRFVTEDGSSIYKLTDFGAAKELAEEEQFMSLYGTEEYLHPDMYERAVLRQPSPKQFGATVDLWSLGVTLYHVVTGELPFQPFGGRRNKHTMFQITTKKESGVISGIQRSEGGRIEWSRQLPSTCLISDGLKRLLTPLLAGLLECNPDRVWGFEQLFAETFNIVSKKVLHVFDVWASKCLRIYVDNNERYNRIQELIAEQSAIGLDQQLLLHDGNKLLELISPSDPFTLYPETTEQNPVFLFPADYQEFTNLRVTSIPPFPHPSNQENLDQDYILAKSYASNLCFIKNQIKRIITKQNLINRAVKMFSHIITKDTERIMNYMTHFSAVCDETYKRMQGFIEFHETQKQLLSISSRHYGTVGRQPILETDLNSLINNTMKASEKLSQDMKGMKKYCDDYYKRLVEKKELYKMWQPGVTCDCKCIKRMEILISDARQITLEFKMDRKRPKLSFNDRQVHMFNRTRLIQSGDAGSKFVREKCLVHLNDMHRKMADWFRVAYKTTGKVKSLETFMNDLCENQRKYSKNQDAAQIAYRAKVCDWFIDLDSQIGTKTGGGNVNASVSQNAQSNERKAQTRALLYKLKDELTSYETENEDSKKLMDENERLMKRLQELNIENGQTEAELFESMISQ
ncbi:serine/threonine-protein kinase TBK1-like [Tubulanus polymorphus]|uniref:serine/threonine-protein kinase TBK1-like n=1 Tax=Tubulanus polymorphus TaxID=672921 RepID=UPI003DA47757